MGYRSTYSGCRIRVDGIPVGPSRFVVQACVEYDARLSPKERARLAPSTQMKAILAVLGEAERALKLGLGTVRVAVVGDPKLERFFREWSPGGGAAVPGTRALPGTGSETPGLHAGAGTTH